MLKTSADLVAKQIEHEKTQLLISEAERAFELIGRAIRMAGYRSLDSQRKEKPFSHAIDVQKNVGYRGSDALTVKYEISGGVDFDCLGNSLNSERTKNGLVHQGFLVDRQASIAKGTKANGGSLICQSLDRQGRLQNTTLMNGVDFLSIVEINGKDAKTPQKLFKIRLQMTDGAALNLNLERTFGSRNLQ